MQDACLHFNHLRSHEYVFSLSLAHGRTRNARDAVRRTARNVGRQRDHRVSAAHVACA